MRNKKHILLTALTITFLSCFTYVISQTKPATEPKITQDTVKTARPNLIAIPTDSVFTDKGLKLKPYKKNAHASYYADRFNGKKSAKTFLTALGSRTGVSKDIFVKEELPFEINAGISKKLADAPLQFSLTLQQLQRFNLLGSDTSFIISESGKQFSTIEKMMSHVVLGAQLAVNENIHCNLGYNVLRRQSLNGYNITNGLNGVTFGVAVLMQKLHINYAT